MYKVGQLVLVLCSVLDHQECVDRVAGEYVQCEVVKYDRRNRELCVRTKLHPHWWVLEEKCMPVMTPLEQQIMKYVEDNRDAMS